MNNLQKECIVKIGEKNYTIPFPKVRQQFEIENKKHLLASNTYGIQERANTESSTLNLNMIDAVAHFSVLLPDLYKDLGVESYYELDMMQIIPILKAYKDTFYPWYEKILKSINAELYPEDKDKDEKK